MRNGIKWSSLLKSWIKLGVRVFYTDDGTGSGDFSSDDFNNDFYTEYEVDAFTISTIEERAGMWSYHYVSNFHTGLHKDKDVVFSIYAKKGSRNLLELSTEDIEKDALDVYAIFNLDTGLLVRGTGTITAEDDGFYRCSVTAKTKSIAPFNIRAMIVRDDYEYDYQGEINMNLHLAAAQLEYGTTPTGYVQTMGYAR